MECKHSNFKSEDVSGISSSTLFCGQLKTRAVRSWEEQRKEVILSGQVLPVRTVPKLWKSFHRFPVAPQNCTQYQRQV